MSSLDQRERTHGARLAQLTARVEREFAPGMDRAEPQRVVQLLALLEGFQTLIADMQATRDEIGTQLRGSMAGQKANAAYRASAGLLRK